MKKTLKVATFALSFLLGAGIFAQSNVYAKEKPNRAKEVSRVEKVQASDKVKNSAEKTMPYGLSKSTLPPVIKQNGILIPVKAITKSIGADLAWDDINQLVTITKGDVTIVINLATKVATVNGTEVAMQDSSESANNGTFVPLKFIAENLGINLDQTDIGQTTDGTQVSDGTQTSDSNATTQVDTSTDNTSTTDSTTSIDTTIVTQN